MTSIERKNYRIVATIAVFAIVLLAMTLIIVGLRSSLSYFAAPSELHQQMDLVGKKIRIGGLLKEGSVLQSNVDGKKVTSFKVTDGTTHISVTTSSLLPNLFVENNGVVVEGIWSGQEPLIADRVIARHDENYMPKEAVEALKKSGNWRGPDPQ